MEIVHLFHFRSVSHGMWFVLTMGILLTATVFYIRSARRGLAPDRAWVNTYPLAHIATALIAVWRTRGGIINTAGFSVDCIWFNPLMALLHIAVFAVFQIYHKRRLREN